MRSLKFAAATFHQPGMKEDVSNFFAWGKNMFPLGTFEECKKEMKQYKKACLIIFQLVRQVWQVK